MAGLSSFLALALAATVWLVLREDTYVAPSPGDAAPRVRAGEAAAALQDLTRAIRADRPEAAAALAAADDRATRSRLGDLVENAHAAPLADVSFRYVDELAGTGVAGEWSATVVTTWRVAGVDDASSSADVRIDFAADGGRVVVAGIGGDGGTTPVWMSGPLDVRREGSVVVLAASDADRYAVLARRAVTVVRRVLPGWDGTLVIEVPRRAGGVDAALDVDRGTFRNVAGVTAAVGGDMDGSGGGRNPVHVFLNPEQMRKLRPAGAQVVVSHEAVHVALDAPSSSLPTWLSEGFADYVALRDVDLPLSTTAAQIIRQVREDGVPPRLPEDEDFDGQSASFGAAYEAAWLACRLLAEQEGEPVLLRLYRRADGAEAFDRVFTATTGVRVDSFTEEWQILLRDLAA